VQQIVEVRRLYPWAILPGKRHVDRADAREEAQLLAGHFRFHRQFRHAEACPPWVMGQELGWEIRSPVTVELSQLDDVQLAAGDGTAVQEAGQLFGRDEFWRRGDGFIATARTDWLRTYQFRGHSGEWQGMFLPNGQGSVEWRLGFALRIPAGYFLLVSALDDADGFTVPTGVLTDRQVNRTWDEGGFSIALRPDRRTTVNRDQPIARIVLLPRESLQARIVNTEAQAEEVR
jgi:hypothetical protein